MMVPMSGSPNRGGMRTKDIMAVAPDVMGPVPNPEARNPEIVWARRRRRHFHDRNWRRDSNVYARAG